MDSSQRNGPQHSSPSEKLSSMNLNSTPTKRTLSDHFLDTSSPGSVFDATPSLRSRSMTGSPSLIGSPSPRTSPSPLPQALNRPKRQVFAKKSSRATHAGSLGKASVDKWSPKLPYELWDMIFRAVLATDMGEEWNVPSGAIYQGPRAKEVMSTLRLVNREWSHILSRRLFSHVSAMVGLVAGRPLEAVFKISESRFASCVHDLHVGIIGPWQNGLDYEQYITDLSTGALSVLISRFSNLRTLRLQSPTLIAPFSPEDQITVTLLSNLTNSLVHALRYVSLPRLRSLYLTLPVTAEFGRFFVSESYAMDFRSILAQLQELHLVVNDDSGRDGHRDMKRPRSLVKTKFPLQAFCGYLITVISSTRQLKILSVETRAPLELSSLESHNLNQMTCFRLVGVSITFESLQDVFMCACATLRRIELEHVLLMTGTWADLFDLCLSYFPKIEFFATTQCGYARSGVSSHLSGHAYAFLPAPLLTRNDPDWTALGKVRRMVNDTRKTLGLCPFSQSTWVQRHLTFM